MSYIYESYTANLRHGRIPTFFKYKTILDEICIVAFDVEIYQPNHRFFGFIDSGGGGLHLRIHTRVHTCESVLEVSMQRHLYDFSRTRF